MNNLVPLFVIIPCLFVFYASNAISTLVTDFDTKRDAGEATSVVYNNDWETVYDAVKYVLRHSENISISVTYVTFCIDSAIEEKAIYYHGRGVGVGIFLKPLADNRTQVDYVDYGFDPYPKGIVKAIIEELPYLLEHGQKAYREYTHKLKVQWDKEVEEESKSKHGSAFD